MMLFDLSFTIICFLIVLKAVIYFVITARFGKGRKDPTTLEKSRSPSVDFIVPAYNEETGILKTINTLLKVDYSLCSVIVVDDGSSDNTWSVVKEHFGGDARVSILRKENGGKSSALNYGIEQSAAEIVICIDADTVVKKDTVHQILPYFTDDVAAVSGHLKVGNVVNDLTRLQYLEYISALDFERKVFDRINGITVVPGAIGAFQRMAVLEVGGFTSDTMAEDCDLTIRLLRRGYTIRNAPFAVALTEAPESLMMFLRQRFRWTKGMIQNLRKHKVRFFSKRTGAIRWIVIPYLWLYRVILPVILPLIEYFFFFTCITTPRLGNIAGTLFLIAADIGITVYILFIEQETKFMSFNLIPAKLIYRHLNFFVFLGVFLHIGHHTSGPWKKIERTGKVCEE
jgi:cellulose synthase/poly-beta-1,6-N-acetylglucosamine synthase-like glycosyltransferase